MVSLDNGNEMNNRFISIEINLKVSWILAHSCISLLSGYENLAQGGDSIYGGVDYKWCSGGPN